VPNRNMARPARRRPHASLIFIGCLVFLQQALQVSSFVGSTLHPVHRREHTVARAGDADEVAALLAQAEALRREAAAEEEEVQAARTRREEEEKDMEGDLPVTNGVEQAATGEDPALAKARAELAAARANLEAAKLEAEAVAAGRAVPHTEGLEDGQTQSVPASAPLPTSGNLEDVKLNFSGTVMTEEEWTDLAKRFEDMNWIEQFQTNSRLGPQGRRKLKALRDGETGRSFILPGERVRLLEEDKAFRDAFSRFPAGSLNGYTAEKWGRRGQECIIEKAFNDKTITCVFADGTRLDFPNEVILGYSDK